MENNNHKSGGNFFSGFLLGALVGAGLVFLFGTEKGKKVLKAIGHRENVRPCGLGRGVFGFWADCAEEQ